MASKEGLRSPIVLSLEICDSFDELSSAALRSMNAAAQDTGDSVCVEERTVTLDSSKKNGLIKNIPASIHVIESEQELRRYSFDALKKLARAENLHLEKSSSRERVVQALEELRSSRLVEDAPQRT